MWLRLTGEKGFRSSLYKTLWSPISTQTLRKVCPRRDLSSRGTKDCQVTAVYFVTCGVLFLVPTLESDKVSSVVRYDPSRRSVKEGRRVGRSFGRRATSRCRISVPYSPVQVRVRRDLSVSSRSFTSDHLNR